MQADNFLGVTRKLVSFAATIVLAGCGTGEEDGISPSSYAGANLIQTTLTGSVGDGPITQGRVVIQNASGQIVATQRSSETAEYRIQVSVSREEFPLIARVDDGTDIVTGGPPSFELSTAIMEPGGEQIVNLNPFGTVALKIALRMEGGLNAANLSLAAATVTDYLGFGIDAHIAGNPMFTAMDSQNTASVIRSSEALGEVIRRTHGALLSTGEFNSPDEIIDALSADLVDGSLDGVGADGATPRLAATTSIASAQVMLEILMNRLEVDGAVATQSLDAAIQQVLGVDAGAPLTGSLFATQSMLTQARTLIEAAAQVDARDIIGAIGASLEQLQAGQGPGAVRELLPAGASTQLSTTLQLISLASPDELAAVNDVMRDFVPPRASPTNRPPIISGIPDSQIMSGSAYEFRPMANDADGDQIVFSISGMPGWASFNAASGVLVGTPGEGDIGASQPILISASDGVAVATLPPFQITVLRQPNRVPTISGTAPPSVTAGNAYQFLPTSADDDGDQLEFTVTNLPRWAVFDPGSGRLSGTPAIADVGEYGGIQIGVSDGDDRATLAPFSISVSGTLNEAPSISGLPMSVAILGNSYAFTPVASDLDGDTLTFTIEGLPSWASFNPASGRLSGIPTTGDEGTYPGILIGVTDGRDSAALPPFSIVVERMPNSIPTITGVAPATLMVGEAYDFTPIATDADGDDLVFSIAGRPAWISFDPATGRLAGVPDAGDEGVFTGVSISVSDGRDTASLPAFAITVAPAPNRAPTISGSPSLAVTAGATYEFTPIAVDDDGDTLSFSIDGRPAWANFSAVTGALSGVPAVDDIGTYTNIRISVSDGLETVALPAFTVSVEALPNRAPTISGTPASSVTVGSLYAFEPTAVDADGDALSFAVSGLPTWAEFDAATGQLSGIPAVADVGSYAGITISVTDGQATADLAAFTIVVSDAPNQPPSIAGSPASDVTVDSLYQFTPSASDADGDSLTYTIAGRPSWASFDVSTGRLAGVPMTGDEGTYPGIRISVTDGMDTVSLPEFAIVVSGLPNSPPVISGLPASNVTVGSSYSFVPTATDADGDNLSFSIIGQPSWATFDAATGRLAGTPAGGDQGVWSGIRISVSDGRESSALPPFAVTVDPLPNTPPSISGTPALDVTVGDLYSFSPSASDVDGDNLSFSVTGIPSWASFESGTGRLLGVPADGDEGVYAGIVISVSDADATTALPAFAITVNARPNRPPSIGGTPSDQAVVGSGYTFRPTASDPDGDSLTFSITGMPAWAIFDTATGRLSGIPSAGEEGDYAGIVISTSDGQDSASLPAFTIRVEEPPNTPPTISGLPGASVEVAESYEFLPAASDADGDLLTFAIAGLPNWADFDTATGRLSGIPSPGEEGSYPNIRISVSDGTDSAALPAFAITVSALPNRPPTIDGVPPTEVTIGSGYSFTPTAADPDGDNLIFSVSGLPGWANFDVTSGELSGTPIAGDEGTYTGIRISVWDGSESVSLDEFDISVVAQALGSALLSWNAPTDNADGSVLEDLDGFKVHYGTELGNYPNVAEIENPSVTTFLAENLTSGTWYFVVTAYDTAGNESVYSNLASTIIP